MANLQGKKVKINTSIAKKSITEIRFGYPLVLLNETKANQTELMTTYRKYTEVVEELGSNHEMLSVIESYFNTSNGNPLSIAYLKEGAKLPSSITFQSIESKLRTLCDGATDWTLKVKFDSDVSKDETLTTKFPTGANNNERIEAIVTALNAVTTNGVWSRDGFKLTLTSNLLGKTSNVELEEQTGVAEDLYASDKFNGKLISFEDGDDPEDAFIEEFNRKVLNNEGNFYSFYPDNSISNAYSEDTLKKMLELLIASTDTRKVMLTDVPLSNALNTQNIFWWESIVATNPLFCRLFVSAQKETGNKESIILANEGRQAGLTYRLGQDSLKNSSTELRGVTPLDLTFEETEILEKRNINYVVEYKQVDLNVFDTGVAVDGQEINLIRYADLIAVRATNLLVEVINGVDKEIYNQRMINRVKLLLSGAMQELSDIKVLGKEQYYDEKLFPEGFEIDILPYSEQSETDRQNRNLSGVEIKAIIATGLRFVTVELSLAGGN